jgi:hypothetical protein
MRKNILLCTTLCLTFILARGQTTGNTSGGIASGSGGSLTYSVGEVAYTNFSSTSTNINQGVQQPEINALLSVKVFLSGSYDINTGLMKDSLRAKNLIPLLEPYSAPPFNKPLVLENPNESIVSTLLNANGANSIVDWVLLELRAASSPSSIVATRRALVQRDGDVVSNSDGSSPVLFTNLSTGNYFVCVKHRNHLGVMTANPVFISPGAVIVDFTSLPTVFTNMTFINAARRMEGGVYTLWPADANNNKNIKYNGLSNDKDLVLNAVGGVAFLNTTVPNIYRIEDLNMDGKIRFNNTDNDRSVILNTLGAQTPNNIFNQHTPN